MNSQSRRIWLAGVVGVVAVVAASAQPDAPKPGTLIGEEKRVRDELDSAARLAADNRFDDAIRRYQQILAESGDLFVTVSADKRHALPARWLVHQHIAALPVKGRRLFRAAVEESARKWLELGIANRDPRLLEQVVSEAFCSESAEQALHMLGDLALERGEFELAEHYWHKLALYPSELDSKPGANGRLELLYPDPEGDGALAQAKLILGLLFRDEKQRARIELDLFRKMHASSVGSLAGKSGRLADTLSALVASSAKWTPAPTAASGAKWTTFGGDPARNLRVPSLSTPYWPDTPHWTVKLPGDPKAKPHKEADPPLGTVPSARSLAFHPVIVPGYVLVADAARVFAFGLADHRMAAEFDYRTIASVPESLDLRVPSRTDARYTLTVVGNHVYARFGVQPVKPPSNPNKAQEIDSAIVCLALERSGKELKLRYRWQIRARALDSDVPAMFEGAPLVRDGRLYAAKTQFDGRQVISSIVCYDADNSDGRDEAPPLRWKQDIWNVEQPPELVRNRHDLLTLAGPNVVYCTHSGAVIALDAATGKRAWAYLYEPAKTRPPDGVQPRDLCPCVASNGRIFAAPADSDRILCLDARTGFPVWQSQSVNVVQLLGVSDRTLFATLGGYPHGIAAFDIDRNGKVLWRQPDEGDRVAFGRGFMTDRWIFWPTRNGLRVLRQDNGAGIDAGSSNEPWGNLAFGEGCLVLATATELWGFVSERARLGERREQVDQQPESAQARFRLALAEADAGDLEAARAAFAKAEELAQGEWLHGRPLKDVARHRLHEILLMQAEQAWKLEKKDDALVMLREASGESFAMRDRVQAWALRHFAGDKSFPDLFEDAQLRSTWLTGKNGWPIRADDYLYGLLDEKGRAEFETRAASRPELAIDRFPRSQAAQSRLKELAHKADSENNLWEAAGFYRLHQTEGRFGLAKVYSQAGYKGEADILKYRLAPTRVPVPDPPAVGQPLDVNLPLKPVRADEITRFREWPLGPLRDPARGDDAPVISEEGCAFFFDTRRVICRSLTMGKAAWKQPIEHDARWCTFHAEAVVVAGPNGVSRLRRSDGKIAWQFTAPNTTCLPQRFPDPSFRTLAPPSESPAFSAFCLAGARLFFLWGDQKLLALDVETGEPLWVFDSGNEEHKLNEHYLPAIDQVLVQAHEGCLGLDAATGRVLYRHPAPARWLSPPIAIDARRAISVGDRSQIKAIELESGREIWSRAPEGSPSRAGAAPQIRRDGSHVLVITERNYGFEFERWAIADGKPARQPVFIGRDAIDLAASALHASACVFMTRNSALGIDRDSGRQLWEIPLPRRGNETWRALSTNAAVLLYPDSALPLVDLDWLFDRAGNEVVGIPSLGRIQNSMNMLYHGYSRRAFPLLAIDVKAGKTIQELKIPASGPRAMMLLGHGHCAVATEGKLDLFR